jgi:hypothetical protein
MRYDMVGYEGVGEVKTVLQISREGGLWIYLHYSSLQNLCINTAHSLEDIGRKMEFRGEV